MNAVNRIAMMDLMPLSICGIKLNAQKFEASVGSLPLDLTLSEFKILHSLVRRPGYVCTRHHLIEKISDGINLVDRNIDVHISSLRKKLGKHRVMIETVRGLGYRFNMEIEIVPHQKGA